MKITSAAVAQYVNTPRNAFSGHMDSWWDMGGSNPAELFLFVGFNQKNILFHFLEFLLIIFKMFMFFSSYGEGIDLFFAPPAS